MTFTGDPEAEVRRMAQSRFAITGSIAAATQRAAQLVDLLDGIAVEISEERRLLYHTGLCHASNPLVRLHVGTAPALPDSVVEAPAAVLEPLDRKRAARVHGVSFRVDF